MSGQRKGGDNVVRIKICGITREADAIAAARAGADAIGLVFAKSPRRVSVAQARKIVAALPPFVAAVGVFVNEKPARIRQIAGQVGLTAVQLHGDESPAVVKALRTLRVIKAVRVRDAGFMADVKRYAAAGAAAILLDAHDNAGYGGLGKTLDWRMVRMLTRSVSHRRMPPIILAGGLNVDNVTKGIRTVRPWGVDVSSGVESRPGLKSSAKMRQFVAAAKVA